MGKMGYVLSIEPDNDYFAQAYERIGSMSEYFREDDYYYHLRVSRIDDDDDCLPF